MSNNKIDFKELEKSKKQKEKLLKDKTIVYKDKKA